MKDAKAPAAQEEKLPLDIPVTQDTKVPAAAQAEDKAKQAQKEAKAPAEQTVPEKVSDKSAEAE